MAPGEVYIFAIFLLKMDFLISVNFTPIFVCLDSLLVVASAYGAVGEGSNPSHGMFFFH